MSRMMQTITTTGFDIAIGFPGSLRRYRWQARAEAQRDVFAYKKASQSNTAPFIDRICHPDADGAKAT
jgi:hypothetical protein